MSMHASDLVLVSAQQLKPIDEISGFQVRPGFSGISEPQLFPAESTLPYSLTALSPVNFSCSTERRKSLLLC